MKTKRIVSLTAALLLCLSLALPAFAIVEPSESFYCADYANVLSDSTEQMICVYNGALEWECHGAQIVVVTVDYLDGMGCDEYAYQLFNDWGVGSGEYNNGMLLLLATRENKAWLAYGLGFQSRLSTKDVNRMLNKYFWKDFDAGKYDSAVSRLFKELVKWYDGVYSTNISGHGKSSGQPDHYGSGTFPDTLDWIVRVFLLIILINSLLGGGISVGRRRLWAPMFFLLHSRNNRGGFGGYGGGFGGGFGGHHGSGRGGGGFSGGGGGRR